MEHQVSDVIQSKGRYINYLLSLYPTSRAIGNILGVQSIIPVIGPMLSTNWHNTWQSWWSLRRPLYLPFCLSALWKFLLFNLIFLLSDKLLSNICVAHETVLAWQCHSTLLSRGRIRHTDCRGPSRESSGSRQPVCHHIKGGKCHWPGVLTHLTDCIKKINGESLISHRLISRQRAAVETLHNVGGLLSCDHPQYWDTLWDNILVSFFLFSKKVSEIHHRSHLIQLIEDSNLSL